MCFNSCLYSFFFFCSGHVVVPVPVVWSCRCPPVVMKAGSLKPWRQVWKGLPSLHRWRPPRRAGTRHTCLKSNPLIYADACNGSPMSWCPKGLGPDRQIEYLSLHASYNTCPKSKYYSNKFDMIFPCLNFQMLFNNKIWIVSRRHVQKLLYDYY